MFNQIYELFMENAQDFRLVYCNTDLHDEAKYIAKSLVADGLAACVSIIPNVQSIYTWQGKVEETNEYTLLIKTSKPLLDAVETRIIELHSYDTPEIIAVAMDSANEKYKEWLQLSLREI